jgi:hypothetical protein
MLGACQRDRHWSPEDRSPRRNQRRSPPMTTLTLTARYARYLLTSLAAVAFGMAVN